MKFMKSGTAMFLSLVVTVLLGLQPNYSNAADVLGTKTTPLSIPDDGWFVTNSINISAPTNAVITGIDLHFSSDHQRSQDIEVFITNGYLANRYYLWNHEGGTSPNPTRTTTGISQFNGLKANGFWNLYVRDTAHGSTGSITEWTVRVFYTTDTGTGYQTYKVTSSILPNLTIGHDENGDGYFEDYQFVIASDYQIPDGMSAYSKIKCNTTGQQWVGGLYSNRHTVLSVSDSNFSQYIKNNSDLTFTEELWDDATYSHTLLASTTVSGGPIKAGPAFYTQGFVNSWTPGTDSDSDGYYDTYQFQLGVAGSQYATNPISVLAKLICIETGQVWWSSAPFMVSTTSPYQYFDFSDADFVGHITGNTTLNFIVELWDPTKTTKLDTARSWFYDSTEVVNFYNSGLTVDIGSCSVAINNFTATSTLFDPYTGGNTNFTADITATPSATWRLNINNEDVVAGNTNPVSQLWYGKNALGQILDPGIYTATLTATDSSGQCSDSKSILIAVDRKATPPNSCIANPNIPVGSTSNVTTGDLAHSQGLFSLKGAPFAIDIELFYNSLNPYNGSLSLGWTHSYDIVLTENPDGSILLREGNGGKSLYTKSGDIYNSPSGDYSVLEKKIDSFSVVTYVITYRDGYKYNFRADGKIVSITDRYNNAINFTYTNGDLTSIADPAGRNVALEFDTAINPHRLKKLAAPGVTVSDTDDKKFLFDYNATGLLWKITSPKAQSTSTNREYWEYTYFPNGFLKTKRDTNNNITSYEYWPDGRMKTSVDPEGQISPAGHSRTLVYNDEATSVKTTTFTEKDGGVWTYVYDTSLGVLKQKIAPSSNQNAKPTTYYYYPDGVLKGYLKAMSEPFGDGEVRITFYSYDSYGNQTKSTEPLKTADYPVITDPNSVDTALFGTTGYPNWAIVYTYDYANFDMLKSITDLRSSPQAVTTFKYFTENGLKVTTVVDPEKRGVIYRYNQNGTLKEIIDANNTTVATDDTVTEKTGAIKTILEYYPTDPASAQYVVGRAGLLWWTRDMNNVTTTITDYDINGNIKKVNVTDKNGAAIPVDTTFVFDALNRLTQNKKISTKQTKAFDDIVTDFNYDVLQNVLSITDAMQHTTSYKRNYQGQVTKITDAKLKDTVFTYNGSGCASCGGGVDKLTGVYDPRFTSQTPLESQPHTVFQYDKTGRLEYETDPLLKKLHYTYYDNGLVWKKYDATTTTEKLLVTYSYNSRGQLTDKVFADNSSDRYTYFPNGTLETATSRDKDNVIVISYTYTWYKNGWLKSVTDNTGKIISYDLYDGIGQRKLVTILKNNATDQRQITYEYDTANRLYTITSPSGTFTFGYDHLGRRNSLTYPNNTVTDYVSDDLDRLTSLTHSAVNGSCFLAYGYTEFDKVGNRKTRTGTSPQTYDYDELYRLLQAVTTKGTENFTYDEAGNRQTGPGFKDSDYSYNDVNQVTTGRKLQYSYDNLGNQTARIIPNALEKSWTQTWDYENRLVKAEFIKGTEHKTVTFKYDPLGRRIEKKMVSVIDGVTKTSTYGYVYDNEDIVLENFSTATGTEKTWYTHGPGIDEPLSLERQINGGASNFYYYHADGLGSIAAITNAAKQVVQSYEYESFGLVKPSTGFANSYTFTGREWDKETGLMYYRGRTYDMREGRFLSKDPISYAGGINLYAYVQNNPINWIDPTGLEWVNPVYWWLDQHYDRNQYNNVVSEQEAKKRMKLESKERSIYHCQGAGNENNKKYISDDGSELVFDKNGKLVTDPVNMGTYNYVVPGSMLKDVGHALVDVVPYIVLGNTPVDPISINDIYKRATGKVK